MSEIGVGQGATLTRAQKAVLDLTGNKERDVEIIQAAIDEAIAERADKPKEPADVAAAVADLEAEESAPPLVVEEEVETEEEHPTRRRRR